MTKIPPMEDNAFPHHQSKVGLMHKIYTKFSQSSQNGTKYKKSIDHIFINISYILVIVHPK